MTRTLALLLLLAVAGCADDTVTSPTRESVEGVWRIISIQPASQPVQLAPVGVQYQVSFDNGMTLVRADCNTCVGPFTRSGNTLAIGPSLACTRAACATAAFETTVIAMLADEHQMTMTLHNLTLSSDLGTILLQR